MSTLRCIPASLAPRAKRDSKRSPSGSKRSRGPVPKGTRFSRLNSHSGFLTRNHKLIFREASAKLFSQINRVKNEGGLTRVAPLGVEAALSSERSVGGAFARLFNKQDCRQSYYRYNVSAQGHADGIRQTLKILSG